MFMNQLRYFKLFVLFFTVIFISTSCQPPNLTNNKIENKTDKNFYIKTLKPLEVNLSFLNGIEKEKRSFNTDDYNKSKTKAIGISYYRDFLGNAYELGDTINLYLLFQLNDDFIIPAGSFGLQNLSHVFYINGDAKLKSKENGKYIYTIDLYNKGWAERNYYGTKSVGCSDYNGRDNVPQLNALGEIILIDGIAKVNIRISSTIYGANSIACSCSGYSCYSDANVKFEGDISWEQNVDFPIKDTINISSNPSEINDTNLNSKITVKPSNVNREWTLEVSKEATSNCEGYISKQTGTGEKNITLPENSNILSQGEYTVKAYYTNNPDNISEPKIVTVKNNFELNINPETVVVGQKANIEIKAKNRSWSLETKEPSTNPTPDPSESPVPLADNGDLTIEKTFDKVGDYTFTLTPKSCSETVNAITKTVKVVLVAPTPLPSTSTDPSSSPSIDPSIDPSVDPSGSVPPIDISISPSSGSTSTPDPNNTSSPVPDITPSPKPSPTPSVLGEGEKCESYSELQSLEDRGLITYLT